MNLDSLRDALEHAPKRRVTGRVVQAVGPVVEANLPGAALGALCEVGDRLAEVVGVRGRRALLMPLQSVHGVGFGTPVRLREEALRVVVGDALRGRVLNGLGKPIDGGPPIHGRRRAVQNNAPDPLKRKLIDTPLQTGVRVIDGLLTLGRGQRVSIMAGSGVGKSTLLGQIARHVTADVNVICLVGERGREVREFVEHNLGPEGMARSVLVIATSDESPALQVRAAFLATTIAEGFRDEGKDVLLLVDSLTRLAMAQRTIGLAAGEPPATRGYTPSVFSMLPPLLERAGPAEYGSITGIYTVLVEADDPDDPIGDAVRGIVDGHIVLSRRLASHGHYPAVDVLASLSRLMERVSQPEHFEAARRFRHLLATWQENEELVRLGAYRPGSSPIVDEALARHGDLVTFLQQGAEPASAEQTLQLLSRAAGV